MNRIFRTIVFVTAIPTSVFADARSWKDATGNYAIDATLIRLERTSVTLKKGDGTQVLVPRDKLSAADQRFLQQLEAVIKKPASDEPALRFRRPKRADDPPISANGLVVCDMIKNGKHVQALSGRVPFFGDRTVIDVPGSRNIKIQIDPVAKSTNYAGLKFAAPCTLAILEDGTLTADRENLRGEDKQGGVWVSRKMIYKNSEQVMFFLEGGPRSKAGIIVGQQPAGEPYFEFPQDGAK